MENCSHRLFCVDDRSLHFPTSISPTTKNAKCEGHFVPNEKAAPQFAFANEEQPQPVLCFFNGELSDVY